MTGSSRELLGPKAFAGGIIEVWTQFGPHQMRTVPNRPVSTSDRPSRIGDTLLNIEQEPPVARSVGLSCVSTCSHDRFFGNTYDILL